MARLTDLTAFSGTLIDDLDEFWIDDYNALTATMTNADPCVVTVTTHGLEANNIVVFTTTGALPTNVVSGTDYYVLATGLTANDFQISATAGGVAIDSTAGTQSGVHTATYYVSRKMSGLQLKTLLASITNYSADFTPGTVAVANTITHNLDTTDINVELWDIDTNEQIFATIDNRTVNAVDITFDVNPTGDVRIVVLGAGGNTIGLTGAGTLNYLAKWTPDGDKLGDSLIQDNGTTQSINTALSGSIQLAIATTKASGVNVNNNGTGSLIYLYAGNLYGVSAFAVGVNLQVYNATVNVGARFSVGVIGDSSIPATTDIGVVGTAKSTTKKNLGAYYEASGANSLDNVGLHSVANSGANNYSLQLEDTTEAIDSVLTCMTADGKANWGKVTSAYTTGATGTFTTVDLKTVTVTNGIITSIV